MPISSKTMTEPPATAPLEDGESLTIAQARAGDREAFGRLVRIYQDRVFNVCLRIVTDRQIAEDLTQEAFIKAHRSIARFDGRAAFYTWLYRIAVNLCLSQRRARKPIVSLDQGDEKSNAAARLAADGPSPMDGADRHEKHDAVLAALAELDEESKAVVVLRDIESLDYGEIAEILNVPTGTVKSRLHRARMALRQRLSHLMET